MQGFRGALLVWTARVALIETAAVQGAAPANEGASATRPAAEEPSQAKPEGKAREDKPQQKTEEKPSENAASKLSDQPPEKPVNQDTRESVCLMIEAAARANDLPLEFFARVIWQESRFQPDAIGPVTRGGERAQGIAQFMPGTAAERRLFDPFNPVE